MCLAIPGKIKKIEKENGLPMAQVDFGGVEKRVHLALTPEAIEGDFVLVHVGVALKVLKEKRANEILSLYGLANEHS